MKLVRPPAVHPGSKVGVIAPSVPLAATYPVRMARGVEQLAATLDVEVLVAPHVGLSTGYTAGSAEQRAAELMAFVADPEVTGIFTAAGGFNSASLLPLLDRAVLRSNPTVFVGYSDATALLNGLQALGGWHTFHGPAVITQLAEFPEPLAFTVDALRSAVGGEAGEVELADPPTWTDEFLDWGTDAWLQSARRPSGGGAREIWREGRGRGALAGGNLETLNFLVGTPYLQVPDHVVLLIEATEAEAYLPRIERALTHLSQAGILGRAAALLIGRSPSAAPAGGVTLRDVVLRATADTAIPVVAQLPFGHTDPMWTLPLGVDAEVLAETDVATIRLLGTGVAA